MADIAVTNETATPLGLYDVDGSYRVAGALGGVVVVDPDTPSREIIDIYTSTGAASEVEASAPENTVAPVASGNVEVGDTVSVTAGTWTGVPTPVLTYQWQVSDGEGWEVIAGETASSLDLIADFVGEDVRCVVTGTNGAGADTANSNPLGPVTSGD